MMTMGMTSEGQIRPPWTPEQVDALNRFQHHGRMHPFTCCGRDGCRDRLGTEDNERLLVATPDGWVCPTCDRLQTWAWAFMAEPQ